MSVLIVAPHTKMGRAGWQDMCSSALQPCRATARPPCPLPWLPPDPFQKHFRLQPAVGTHDLSHPIPRPKGALGTPRLSFERRRADQGTPSLSSQHYAPPQALLASGDPAQHSGLLADLLLANGLGPLPKNRAQHRGSLGLPPEAPHPGALLSSSQKTCGVPTLLPRVSGRHSGMSLGSKVRSPPVSPACVPHLSPGARMGLGGAE